MLAVQAVEHIRETKWTQKPVEECQCCAVCRLYRDYRTALLWMRAQEGGSCRGSLLIVLSRHLWKLYHRGPQKAELLLMT